MWCMRVCERVNVMCERVSEGMNVVCESVREGRNGVCGDDFYASLKLYLNFSGNECGV